MLKSKKLERIGIDFMPVPNTLDQGLGLGVSRPVTKDGKGKEKEKESWKVTKFEEVF